ncbi:ShlB/FhaC/HecB family hemolysin secretion/activation protein [Neorhodopirellula lusitana]|uniref:ShlB/FhaC/HecB family hemolysin secretion/activation protein n=1 Tax=Neorhodopirellula lusitana TaxID=445327 RepID=UPI00384BE408
MDRRFWVAIAFVAVAQTLLSNHAFSQNFERYQPKLFGPTNDRAIDLNATQSPEDALPSSDAVLVDALEAVIILDHPDAVIPHEAHAELQGVHCQVGSGSSLANSNRVHRVIHGHLGKPITLRNLNQLTRDIITIYEKCGQPIVDVQIPEQKITGGTIQIVIVESRISSINVAGAEWLDPCRLRGQITRSRVGGRIHEPCLAEDLYWLNRNPFRSVGLDLQPGGYDGTTDLTFEVDDVFPMRAYMGYEDTGVDTLGLERLYSGLVIGNLFGQDGILGYQFTSDAGFSQLEAHALSYSVDLDRKHSAFLFGSWASASPTLPAPLTQDGEAWQLGSRLFHYRTRTANEESAFYVGTDFKSSNTSVEFGVVNATQSDADLLQLGFGYNAFKRRSNGDYARWNTDVNVSPGDGFTSNNNRAAFSTLRADTAPGYVYCRSAIDLRRQLGCRHELVSRAVGQLASDRLLYSETLGFGGYDSVRGYDQRVANGDNGWLASFEFGPNATVYGCGKSERTLKYYAFSDLGQAFVLDPQVGEEKEQFLASVGVGLRFALADRLALRLDYGQGLNDVATAPAGGRVHVGLVSFLGPTPKRR